MSVSSDIKDYVEAQDAALTVDLLTGGLWDWQETGRMGLNPSNNPDAFNGALLKPCALFKCRQWYPDGDIVDEANQVHSEVCTLEVYVYSEEDIDTIESAIARIAAVLDQANPTGSIRAMYMGQTGEQQAEELNGAAVEIVYFRLVRIREF